MSRETASAGGCQDGPSEVSCRKPLNSATASPPC
jgi:hypothetical protein